MTRSFKLAVVEDDPEFREGVLVPVLRQSGFDVVSLGSALELYKAMVIASFDLVLLDIGLPDENGVSIAAYLRSKSPSLGIVMLTARGACSDRVDGLHAGADAYLCKPVNMKEVVAILLNLSRRIALAAPSPANVAAQTSGSPGPQPTWRLDKTGWRIFSPSGIEVAMNSAERQVIGRLAESLGVPVSREELIARFSGEIYDFDSPRLDLLVYRLRKKCLKLAGQELPLTAVRGIGYSLNW